MMLFIDIETGKAVSLTEILEKMASKKTVEKEEIKAKNIAEPESDLFAKTDNSNQHKVNSHGLPQWMVDMLEKEQTTPEREGKVIEMKPVSEECTGNPENCPVCGEEILYNFSEALDALKMGAKVVRKSWLEHLDVSSLVLVPEQLHDTGQTNEPFIAVISKDETRFEPYIIQNDDLLAKDWLLIEEN